MNSVTTTYQLDLNMGLTQVLSDGTDTYLYGLSRIGEEDTAWNYYLGDALGSVRQLTDSSGVVTLAQTYEPYGEVLATYGTGDSNYDFAGEWTDETGLQYLWARYMNPALGRFISRDTWGGDYNQPHSFNRWNYVEGNPVMYTDPSGMEPCNLASDYCIIENGDYEGFFIDVHHFSKSFNHAKNLINQLHSEAKGNSNYQLNIQNYLKNVIPFSGYYIINLPASASSDLVNRVGFGIFLEFNVELEAYEGAMPSCWLVSSSLDDGKDGGRCSSFANEDLPSDYLGFISYILGATSEQNALQLILSILGGDSYRSSDVPQEYYGTLSQARQCVYSGLCGADSPFNKCALPKIFDVEQNLYVHKQWPQELVLQPIEAGEYWEVQFYNTIYGPVGPNINQLYSTLSN